MFSSVEERCHSFRRKRQTDRQREGGRRGEGKGEKNEGREKGREREIENMSFLCLFILLYPRLIGCYIHPPPY
jgi:hypothetical protein